MSDCPVYTNIKHTKTLIAIIINNILEHRVKYGFNDDLIAALQLYCNYNFRVINHQSVCNL